MKIDSVRKSKTLNPLINDSVLYMASTDHAKFMKQKGELTHYQKSNAQKKTPQKRAEFYGAQDYFVGENVALIYLFTPMTYAHERSDETHTIVSYDQAAHDFVVNWVNSRGHYANILTESYEITGLAVSYDPKEQALYAVQMFAEVSRDYDLKKNSKLFPYDHISYEKLKKSLSAEIEGQKSKKLIKRFEWGLKRPTKSHHCRANTDRLFNADFIQPYIGGDEIGICTYDLARLKRFFRGWRDGLALEVIGFSEAYTCDSDIAEGEKKVLKGESLFSGRVTKPLYRRDILKQIRQHELEQKGRRRDRNRCFNIILAKAPEDFYREHKEIKLVIIKRKRVCSIMSFRSLCGNLISYKVPPIEMDFSIGTDTRFKPRMPEDRFIERIRFEKNSIDFNANEVDSVIMLLQDTDVEIKSLDIKAFASIEGNISDNKGLYQARAFGVLEAIENKIGKSVDHNISAEENWQDFRRDISLMKEYRYLQKMDSAELRDYLSKPENADKLEPMLSKHRYTYVRVKYSPVLKPEEATMYAADEFNAKVLRFKKGKNIPKPVFNRLMRIQTYLFQNAIKDGDAYYDSLFLPRSDKFFPLFFRDLQFKYHIGNYSELEYFVELEKLRKRNKSSMVETAYRIFLINQSGNELYNEYLKPSVISSLIEDLKSKDGQDSLIHELEALYHFSRANSLYRKYGGRNLKRAKSSIRYLYKRFSEEENLSPRFKYSLARYFVLFYKFDYALDLLEEEALSAEPNDYDLTLYLKIMAMRDLESPSEEFRQLLLNAIDQLGKERWCGLFIGQCNIPMDIFDFETILDLYCEECR